MFDLSKYINEERSKIPSPNQELQITERAVNFLVNENIDFPEISNSLLLFPIALLNPDSLETLKSYGYHETIDLVERYILWRNKFQIYDDDKVVKDYSFHLRYLLREAYLEIPNFSFIILAIVYHHAVMTMTEVDELPSSLAEITENIFIPLVSALDLWKMRSAWVDKCAAVLHSEEYQSFENVFGFTEVQKYDRLNEVIDQKKGAKENKWLADHRNSIEKWSTYKGIEQELYFKAAYYGFENIHVSWVEQKSGQAIRSMREGFSKEELVNRIGIRVFCASEEECYQVLGLVHKLGRPVAPKYSERFDDYIASPQVNGYRALHTAVNYKGKIYAGNGKYYFKNQVVEFRILTKTLHHQNRWGIIAFREAGQSYSSNAWWNDEAITAIIQTIRENEINTTSEKIYVFTPQGRILIMNEGDTALDFAYKIHTSIGNKATKILVNSKPKHFSYPLQNGDLVQVFYDYRSKGVEPSWLNYANSFSAKKIRKELRSRGESIHTGRAAIDHVLIKEIELYKEKGFMFHFSSRDVDTFLVKVAASKGLSDIFMLYRLVDDKKMSPHQIIQRLINSTLVQYLLDARGKEHQFNPTQISFCSNCRPVPGEEIIAYERIRNYRKKVVIHTKNNPDCAGASKPGVRKHLTWKQKIDSLEAQAMIEIWAEYRPKLFRDVLDKLDADNKVDFNVFQGERHRDRTAEIVISAFGTSSDDFNQVCTEIKNLPSVTQVSMFPKEPYGKLLASTQNPYLAFSEKVVFDRLHFYNREDEKREIINWINADDQSNWLIIHGKRRVGKTSMCKHIENEELEKDPSINPVFVDMLGLSKYEPIDIARYLVRLIFEKINLKEPISTREDQPFLWLEENLEIACKKIKKEKFVIFLDEFDKLIELHQDARLYETVFNNFRYVMSKFEKIKWIVVVQDYYFRDQSLDLFQLAADHVEIKHLDEIHAKELIERTYQRIGIKIDPSETTKIIRYSDGNPYITKLICRTIQKSLRRASRSKIIDADIKYARDQLLHRGMHHFAHFSNNLTKKNKAILSVIVNQIGIGETKKTEELFKEVKNYLPLLTESELTDSFSDMDSLGVIKVNNGNINIPLCLFHDWAIRNYKFSQIITDIDEE